MNYKTKKKKNNNNRKWSVTVTANGRRIRQSAHAKEVWIEKTRNSLLESRSIYERKVYKWLPPTLKKLAEPQFVIEYQSHVYFADIFIRKFNIAIEVDGEFHYSQEQMQRDVVREQHFKRKGIQTFRIKNSDVADNAKLWEFINTIMKQTL